MPASIPDVVDYMRNPQSSLAIIRCNPWTVNGKVASSAMPRTPSCLLWRRHERGLRGLQVLNDLLNEHGDDNWPEVLARYAAKRKPNGDAIADLSPATSWRCATSLLT